MTETTQGKPTRAVEMAQQIVTILVNEDAETRRRVIQAAMLLLGDTLPSRSTSMPELEPLRTSSEEDADLATFFNRDENFKPSDYAQLCAAYHYSIYGAAPFSLEELRVIANEAGVVLPDRLDMTLNQATKKGKKLFQVAGKGSFKPTAAAGLAFKERWDVKPGKHARNARTASEVQND